MSYGSVAAITISVDASQVKAMQARLRGLQEKKIDAANIAALNDSAREGYEASRREMQNVFDAPTTWVMGGIRYVKARKDRQWSEIDFDKWGNKAGVTVEKVLAANIFAGQRKHKRHEVALQRAGILPPGMAIVPGHAAEMDSYGNMRGSQIVQIIAWFKASGEQGYKANMTDKGRSNLSRGSKKSGYGFAYFALQYQRGKLPPGIYKRIKTGFGYAVKPVMIFVRIPSYSKRFDFYGVAEKAATAQFRKSFDRYLAQMLKESGL